MRLAWLPCSTLQLGQVGLVGLRAFSSMSGRGQVPGPSQEALSRKLRTETALRNAEVPVLETLPVIADTRSAYARTRDEVIRRLQVIGRVQGLGCSEPAVRAGMAESVRKEMKKSSLWDDASGVRRVGLVLARSVCTT